jgi:hypothetical protein
LYIIFKSGCNLLRIKEAELVIQNIEKKCEYIFNNFFNKIEKNKIIIETYDEYLFSKQQIINK